MDARRRARVIVEAAAFAGLIGATIPVRAGVPPSASPQSTQPPTTLSSDIDRRIDVNQINMWTQNNGAFAFWPGTGSVPVLGGLIFPKGSTKNALYGSGLWLGAKVGGDVRTSQVSYSSDFTPGAIIGGAPDDDANRAYRVYKVARYAGSPADTAHVERTPAELAADPLLDPLLHHSWSEYLNGAAPYGAPVRTYRLPNTATPAPDDSVDVLGPDVLGDQMLWTVYNDLAPTRFNSPQPLGVEVQQTTFAFDRQGALGNTVFLKFLVVNKGGLALDDMYVSLWADPDLGDALDDLVGCDPALSVGFVYNANNDDKVYGATPPCVGYDFFLGPVDKTTGDTLGMSAFDKYISGTDPLLPGDVYNYMQGLSGEGNAIVDPTTGQTTHFFHSGDPITGRGWLDSNPSDRRMLLTAGPFNMAPGDTQSVVGAIIVGQGKNRLSSIAAMKFYDVFAQDAFDRRFDLPSPPPAPQVHVAEDHGRITLCWDSASRLTYRQPGYAFEGYNVYQGASVGGPWTLLATYDEVDQVRVIFDQTFDLETGQLLPQYPVAFGSDAGVRFCHTVTQDAVRGGDLKDGTEYYFAVTAYAYGPDQLPKVLENSQHVVRVTPQRAASGTDYATASALPTAYVPLDPTRPPSTDQIAVEVVGPDLVTGHTYQVTFEALEPPVTGQVGQDTATVTSTWSLTDRTTGEVKLTGERNRRGDEDYPIVDGLKVKEVGPYFPLLADAYFEDNNPTHGWPWAAGGVNGNFFFGGAGLATDFDPLSTSATADAEPDSYAVVEIRFDHATTQRAYRFLRLELADSSSAGNVGDPPPQGRGYPYRGFVDVPLTVWDVQRNRQLDVALVERALTDSTGALLPAGEQPATQDGAFAVYDFGLPNDILVVLNRPYSDTPKDAVARDGSLGDRTEPFLYALAMQKPDPMYGDAVPDDGDGFLFAWKYPAGPNDVYTFDTTPLVRGNATLARQRLDRIRVVPNPYYNQSRYELASTRRVVRFLNMPEQATLRIFNLAGHLVRTIEKTDPTSSVLEWDLLNERRLPLGSGIYIYHVDVPGVGSTFGRLALFMESERLTIF